MFYLKEIFRISSQNRTKSCYIILSIWIFLLIAGMYKYIGTTSPQVFFNEKQYNNFINREEMEKIRKYKIDCNPLEGIMRQDDGGLNDDWHLQGVILLIRHGDRGPMSHVKGIQSINCGIENYQYLQKYKIFLSNATATVTTGSGNGGGSPATNGQITWMKTGSFHGFPLLPTYSKACLLGQLTYKGIAQLLQVGEILRQSYGHALGLLKKPNPIILQNNRMPSIGASNSAGVVSTNTNTTQTILYSNDDILIYSTRYRRTFQSVMALLYTFLPQERWNSLTVHESHNLAYCFGDCACPLADYIRKQIDKDNINVLKQHPSIMAVVQWIGNNLLENPIYLKLQPMEIRDAILSILCHNAILPCRNKFNERNYQNYKETTPLPVAAPQSSSSLLDQSMDFINIDQDDQQQQSNNINNDIDVSIDNKLTGDNDSNQNQWLEDDNCIETSHIAAIMSYTNWQGERESKLKLTKIQGLLRAYGLLRNIVKWILKIISGDKIKLILYSGHDRTMQFLASALNLQNETYFIRYAARMAFEIYKSNKDGQYYFRLVYNGRDVTQEIQFCSGSKSLRIYKDNRGNSADLCPIENIVRFIHDDYFMMLNATNFKDACTLTKNFEV